MLTRIEVDGFKNLLGFSAEFGPFTCIAGQNGVGKSNLFDAIELLSLLADMPVKDAARRIRGGGEIRDLFWTDGEHRLDEMRFAVEMVTESVVVDEFERTSPPVGSLYRYELTLGLVADPAVDGVYRLRVLRESLSFRSWETGRSLGFPGAQIIRDKLLVVGGANQNIYRSGVEPSPRTFISTQATVDEPYAMAVRREMQSWRQLALEPAALRRSDSTDDIDEDLGSNGRHLPATIYRLAHQGHDGHPPDPEGFYARLAVRLADLLSVRRIEVDRSDKLAQLSLTVEMLDGGEFPARALSDGFLRFLALAALSFVRRQRLLCIEEPENGIHPSRMRDLVELVRDLATVSETDLEYEQTLRQVIVNTHSPDFVKTVYDDADDAILVATQVLVAGPFDAGARVLRLNPLSGTWRCSSEAPGVGLALLLHYLGASTPLRGLGPVALPHG